MAKSKTVFYCKECGYESAKWLGQCPGCKEWNTFVEAPKAKSASSSVSAVSSGAKPVKLSEISIENEERYKTGVQEFDRVLGGGIVKGSLTLVGGDPGIGKSTLLLQICRILSNNGIKVLYVSGEESKEQVKLRSSRIGEFKNDMTLYCETDLDLVEEAIHTIAPNVVVVDSIQTIYSKNVDSTPGSVSQIRESTAVFMRLAKQEGCAIFIVGHVTKEGVVAGPRILEHMVDTVLYLEGDRYAAYRMLRAVKNRFGATNEIGIFEMENEGLVEVTNPSAYLLSGKPVGATGSVVICAMEGTRPMMVEVQALLSRTNYAFPKRTAAGMDYSRINILAAVMEKKLNIDVNQFDIYVNIVGGMRLREPAMDLAIIAAMISNLKGVPVSEKTIIMGEVGLAGEVRAVNMMDKRITEAKKLGFDTCIIPKANIDSAKNIDGLKVVGISSVSELAAIILKN